MPSSINKQDNHAGSTCSNPTTASSSSSTKKRKVTTRTATAISSPSGATHSRLPLSLQQRQERNEREKRRSSQICDQFETLRQLLVTAKAPGIRPAADTTTSGIASSSGASTTTSTTTSASTTTCTSTTKSTILSSALTYIGQLKQQHYKLVEQNCLLKHQLSKIATLKQQQQQQQPEQTELGQQPPNCKRRKVQLEPGQNNVDKEEEESVCYSALFQNSPIPMAIATLGGTIVEYNDLFCQHMKMRMVNSNSNNHNKNDKITIFALTDPHDLQTVYEQIKEQWLIQPASSQSIPQTEPIRVRSSIATTTATTTTTQNHGRKTTANDPQYFQLCLSPIYDPQNIDKDNKNTITTTSRKLRFICLALVMDETIVMTGTTGHHHHKRQLQPVQPQPLVIKKQRYYHVIPPYDLSSGGNHKTNKNTCDDTDNTDDDNDGTTTSSNSSGISSSSSSRNSSSSSSSKAGDSITTSTTTARHY